MRKILFALCGMIVSVLFWLSPAHARPFFQSDLICLPQFADSGYAVILHPSGDLYINVQTDGPPTVEEVSCQITCIDSGAASPVPPGGVHFVLGPVPCGRTKAAGKVVFRAKGLGNPDNFPPGVPLCQLPSVQVFNDQTIVCTSGYPTPQ